MSAPKTSELFDTAPSGMRFVVKPGMEAQAIATVGKHGICVKCGHRAISGGECKHCGTCYLKPPVRREYTPHKDPTMDKRFHAVGIKALRGTATVDLVARVNHLQNFTLWAAHIVADAIIGEVDTKEAEDLEWFQAWHDHLKPPFDSMYDHPMVRDIAQTVYAELNVVAV